MADQFVNLTAANLDSEHLSCIIRTKTIHPGIAAKKQWLAERIKEGHVFRKLDVKGTAFIEYAPLKTAWVPVDGEGYYYIYCLWTAGEYRHKGYGKALMEYCIQDVKKKNGHGLCLLGAVRQKGWLTDESFAASYGFKVADQTAGGYQVYALPFDSAPLPRFTPSARREAIDDQRLTVYYDDQCPLIEASVRMTGEYCTSHDIPLNLVKVTSAGQAKELPAPFNNYALFYQGRFETVNVAVSASLTRRLAREKGESK